MGIFSWIMLGLIAGILAKWIMPGKDEMGLIITIFLGIAGAFVGGYIGSFFGFGTVDGFSIGSILTATAGAFLLLFFTVSLRSQQAGVRPLSCFSNPIEDRGGLSALIRYR